MLHSLRCIIRLHRAGQEVSSTANSCPPTSCWWHAGVTQGCAVLLLLRRLQRSGLRRRSARLTLAALGLARILGAKRVAAAARVAHGALAGKEGLAGCTHAVVHCLHSGGRAARGKERGVSQIPSGAGDDC